MRRTTTRIALALAGSLALAAPAAAQDWADEEPYRPASPRSRGALSPQDERGFGMRLGLGFSLDPDTFEVDLGMPISVSGGVRVGPRVQLGFADSRRFIAPTLEMEYAHDLSDVFDGVLGRIRPTVHGGAGLAWIEKERRRGHNDDAGFLVALGFGAEYPLSSNFSLDSRITIDILPEDTVGESVMFVWQLIGLRMHF